MDNEKEIAITVKLVFSVSIPETIKTSEGVLAEYLVDKLSVDVKWAEIKNKTVITS
ncbi:MAG: hypothetical protein ABSB95_02805 [Dissulfurispiraceae bacterium]|jgi:hypothetical protein